MNEKSEKIVKYFKRYNGIARFSSMRKAGIHPDSIKKAESEGVIEKIGRGLYKLTTDNIESHSDYLLATLQTSKGIICLISALYFYRVTDEIPRVVDIAIPTGARANKIEYPPVQFYRFSQPTWNTGVETHEIEGHKIQIYSLAKTLADCFKFRNRIGINVARESLKIAITEKKVKPTEIYKYAKICRVDKILKPILESMI